MGVPRGSWLSYVVPRGSSLSYGVSCGFFVFLRCSYGVPRGFSLSYGDPRFNRGSSLCFGVTLCSSFYYGVLLQCSSLLYGVPRGTFGFLVFYSALRVSFLPYGVLRDSSLFFGVFLCSGFFRVQGSSWFLSVPCYYTVFFVVPHCSTVFLVVSRVSSLFYGVFHGSSLSYGVFRCS